MKKSIFEPLNILKYVAIIIYCALPFISPTIGDYQLRMVLLTTFIGVMLIPTFLLHRKEQVSLKFLLHESILYLLFLLIIYTNVLRASGESVFAVHLRIAMIHGRVPAFLGLQTYIYIGLFFVMITMYFNKIFTKQMMNLIYWTHIAIGVIMVIIDLVNPNTIMYGFGNPNYATEPFAILYLILVFSIIKEELTRESIILTTLLLVLAFYVDVTTMRFALPISFLVTMFLYYRNGGNKKTILTLVSIFLIAFASSTMFHQFSWITRVSELGDGAVTINAVSSGRIKLWSDIINMVTAAPRNLITGIGPSTYYYFGATNFNAHNMVIEILGSAGILGVLIIGTMTIIMICKSYKVFKLDKNFWVIGYWLFILVKWNLNSLVILTSIYYFIMLAQIYSTYKEKIYDVN